MPKISVILPTYNQAEYLPKCIESVLNQTLDDFEFIIVNDGSTDNSKEIIESYKDKRIRITNQSNKKLPGAVNSGLKISKGEYITWISSDCYCQKDFLKELSLGLDENREIGVVYSLCTHIDKDGKVIKISQKPKSISITKLLSGNHVGPSYMLRKSCVKKVGLYDESLIGTEDWDHWIRIAKHFKFMLIDKMLYYHRLHDKSLRTHLAPTFDMLRIKQYEKNIKSFPLDQFEPKVFFRMSHYYRKTNKFKSLRYYLYALRLKYNPLRFLKGFLNAIK